MVKIDLDKNIHSITLNRPEKRNALSYEMVSELKKAFTSCFNDPSSRVIILKAEGIAFCAGADLAYLQQLQKNTFEENLEDSRHLGLLFELIYGGPKPVIAQIQGHAIAGGTGLASICDFSISVPEAKFGYTEVRIGFIPALVSVFLINKIGEGKARELLLSGRLIEAQAANDYGIINKVVGPEELESETLTLAESLRDKCSGNSISETKKLIQSLIGKSMAEGLDLAANMNAKTRESDDCKKGIQAFLDKEKPKWNP